MGINPGHPHALLQKKAPDLDCTMVQTGRPVKLSDITHNQRPTVVLFHTAWCGACQPAGRTMDAIAAHEFYAGRINVVLINIEGNAGTSGMFVEQNGITSALALATTPESRRICHAEYGVKYIPHHTVIDGKTGNVVLNFDGDVSEALDRLLRP